MHNGRVLDLRSTPQAMAALATLRQLATGPFVTNQNLGRAPVKSGDDIMRPLPVPTSIRALVGEAIDAHLRSCTTEAFQPPVRLAPQHEAHVMWGIGEIQRQRRLVVAESPHPLHRMSADLPLSKAVVAAQTRAARCIKAASATDGNRTAASTGPIAKQTITFAQVQLFTAALQRLRDDQKTSYRLTGQGLQALRAACPGYSRADHLAAAQRRLTASRTARTAQARLDDCQLAEAHAALAIKPRQR